MMRAVLAAAAIVLVAPALAQTAIGGDTIRLDGTIYRLWGIDAPERNQTCADGWPAGRAAIDYLRELTNDRQVACAGEGRDRDGQTVATCEVDGRDLGAAMVAAGMAWAFTRYTTDYVDEEAQANADRLGIHAHDCVPAWEWRAQARR